MIYFSCLQHMQFVCFWQLIDICSVLRNQVWGIKKWLTQSFLKGGVLATFFSRVATSSATSSGSLSLSGNKCRSVPKPHCSPQTSFPATLSISCPLVLHLPDCSYHIWPRNIALGEKDCNLRMFKRLLLVGCFQPPPHRSCIFTVFNFFKLIFFLQIFSSFSFCCFFCWLFSTFPAPFLHFHFCKMHTRCFCWFRWEMECKIEAKVTQISAWFWWQLSEMRSRSIFA